MHQIFVSARIERDSAILASLECAVAPAQAGLFERRGVREAADRASRIEELKHHFSSRIAAFSASTTDTTDAGADPDADPVRAMVAGVSGHLISSDVLAERVRAQTCDVDTLRRLIDWRARCASLGPAASLRAMIEVGVEPFVRILGFAGLVDLRYDEHLASGVLVSGQPIALLATPWGDPLEPMWRAGVVEARNRGAEWCVLFNGRSLRLVDVRRVYSRRFVELDLDIAAEHPDAAGALMTLFGAGGVCGRQRGPDAHRNHRRRFRAARSRSLPRSARRGTPRVRGVAGCVDARST